MVSDVVGPGCSWLMITATTPVEGLMKNSVIVGELESLYTKKSS